VVRQWIVAPPFAGSNPVVRLCVLPKNKQKKERYFKQSLNKDYYP
jgi:hypothetical protein